MHTISVEPQLTMEVDVYNQCPGFKLTNLGHFSNGAYQNWFSTRDVEAGSRMWTNLKPFLSTFEGGITYQLEKKGVGSTYTRLFVAWKSESYKKFQVSVQLIESDETFDWPKTKLEEYYRRYSSQLSTYTDPIKDT
jgi:hypothetical protein